MLPANASSKGDFSKYGFDSSLTPAPAYTDPPEEPLLAGRENLPVEEKARVLTDAWMNGVTQSDLSGMKAGEIKKISEIAGIGSPKKTAADGNPIILAIVAALTGKGISLPTLQVIEGEKVDE